MFPDTACRGPTPIVSNNSPIRKRNSFGTVTSEAATLLETPQPLSLTGERRSKNRRELNERFGEASEANSDNQWAAAFLTSFFIGKKAGEGNRTPVCSLGSCRSAIELHPRCGFRF